MKEYHKIQSIFKRDEKTHRFIIGQWSLPEFEYLKDNAWVWTEKVDGTNVRVMWQPETPQPLTFGGRTDNAQMATFLLKRLQEMFSVETMQVAYPDTAMCLYGEGYGARIQKSGGNYNPTGCDFVLFDVRVGEWWLQRDDVVGIAEKLGIGVVPAVGIGSIKDAITLVAGVGLRSTWGDFAAEGLVLRPQIELHRRNGERIITKLKAKDF